MAITEIGEVSLEEELLARFRRRGRRRRFEEMLGPEPVAEPEEELLVFLAFLEEQRQQPARYPDNIGVDS